MMPTESRTRVGPRSLRLARWDPAGVGRMTSILPREECVAPGFGLGAAGGRAGGPAQAERSLPVLLGIDDRPNTTSSLSHPRSSPAFPASSSPKHILRSTKHPRDHVVHPYVPVQPCLGRILAARLPLRS